MIHFENPFAFILIFTLPLLPAFRHIKLFKKFSFPLTISDWNGKSFSYKNSFLSFFSVLSKILFCLSYLSLITALASPVFTTQEKIYTTRGTDIIFVLDTSPSMAAKDISLINGTVTRLEASKLGIKTIINTETGSSFGLVAMSSEAACIVPATTDFNFFEKQLDSLIPGEFGDGTAIGIGLTTAIYHLSTGKAPQKCIVLITDGENNAGTVHPETAINIARENNINLYILGIGTNGSVPIEYIDSSSGKIHSGFYESNFNSTSLENLAMKAGGKYFGIESLSSLSNSLSEISKSETSVQSFHYRSSNKNYYPVFLLLTIILVSAAWIFQRLFLSEVL